MKKLTLVLISLSISACQPGPWPAVQNASLQNFSHKTDWYQPLSPELKTYYAAARGKQGLPLLESLMQIANQARTLEYTEATAYLYQVLERSPQNKRGGLRAAYSNLYIWGDGPSGHKYKEEGDANRDGKKGDGINCEHTWPQTFFGKTGAMRTDLHHLFPTLSTPNSKRGHHAFGLASAGQITYATQSGSRLARLADGRSVFEPDDFQKGNTARALMYFYLRYHQQDIRQGDYRAQTFFLQNLPLFKAWMQQDPVDLAEAQRNHRIAEKQGNRNPFIDIPNLIDQIGVANLIKIEQALSF